MKNLRNLEVNGGKIFGGQDAGMINAGLLTAVGEIAPAQDFNTSRSNKEKGLEAITDVIAMQAEPNLNGPQI